MQERIAGLVPDKPCPLSGEWQGRPARDTADAVLWRLAALLKFDPETRHYDIDDFGPLVKTVAAAITIDDDDAWRLFSKAYDKVRSGIGSSHQLLQLAKRNAQEAIDLGHENDWGGSHYRDPRRRLLVGIIFMILTNGRNGEHYLSCRNAAELIGVDSSTAAAWIRGLVADGFIKEIAAGTEYKSPRYQWTHT